MRLKRPKDKYAESVILLLSVTLVFSFVTVGRKTEPQAAGPQAGKVAVEEPRKIAHKNRGEIHKEESRYSYNSKGKRDPFESFIYKTSAGEKKRKGSRFTTLQELELSQLKLVGIVLGTGNNRAMVEDPARKGYILKQGTRIGMNNGRVIKILKDSVIIREEYRDYSGKIKRKKVYLKLHRDEKGETS